MEIFYNLHHNLYSESFIVVILAFFALVEVPREIINYEVIDTNEL